MQIQFLGMCALVVALNQVVPALGVEWGLKEGDPAVQSAGALAFGPDGILFVGDTKSATIFAIATGDTKGDPSQVNLNVSGISKQIAEILKTTEETVSINDLATNPQSGNIYLSISVGKGTESKPALIRVEADGKLSSVALTKVPFQKVGLPNPPEDKEVIGRNGRPSNPRNESITDLAYVDGKVYVSGVISGQAPSNVREIPFPFAEASVGSNVEIYHAAHGRTENNATIRTFIPLNIGGEPSLLAGFTCTPLVKFPIESFTPGEKSKGTTVAELGNMNRPLDMIIYKKDGKDFLLMANDRRGVMKISTENIARKNGLTEPVKGGGIAGQTYETIKELEGVTQLDRLNSDHAVIVVSSNGQHDLRTVALP
ncbi:MAG: hypothetical protein FJ267_07835 [Planctomycetes bacterium]|nr:hypothetical protein [Planctomycetota bacterium]